MEKPVDGPRERDQSTEQLLRQSLRTPQHDGVTESCLDAETLAAWADGALSGTALETVQLHVAEFTPGTGPRLVGKLRQGRNTLAARRARVEKLADLHARGPGGDRSRGPPSVGPNSFPITNDFRTETF